MSNIPRDPFIQFDVTKVIGVSTPTSHSQIIENLLALSPTGSTNTIIGDHYYGINHRRLAPPIPINRDHFGLLFFTRPRMNMTTENLQLVRDFIPLLSTQPNSIQRIIRCYLDPQLAYGAGTNEVVKTPFVDDQSAFIPLLSNMALTANGWPDLSLPFFTSPEGVYKETFNIVDGVFKYRGEFDMSCTFRNEPGDPITMLFYYWCLYAALVFEGSMVPYPDMIIGNEKDYETKIYRLVLDNTKTIVQAISTTIAVPASDPTGAKFNYESDRPLNASNDQINITFKCTGAEYFDDILIDEFNRTVQFFNHAMKDQTRTSNFTLLKLSELQLFNYRGYPRINPNTYNLEWWVPNNDYTNMVSILTKNNKAILSTTTFSQSGNPTPAKSTPTATTTSTSSSTNTNTK